MTFRFGTSAPFVHSCWRRANRSVWAISVAAAVILLAACTDHFPTPASTAAHKITTNGCFRVPIGQGRHHPTQGTSIRLPYRDWLPDGPASHVVLALHGFDDSRDAWATIGPVLARHGVAVFAPDQRGFGLSPERGDWAGSSEMVADARSMVATLHRRFPAVPLTVAGESMGGAVSILLAAKGDPYVSSYVLVSPAVWGGSAMAAPARWAAAALGAVVPWLRLTGRQAHVLESDDRAALRRLSEDPLTIHATRLGTVAGIVRMMGAAQADCARFHPAHALVMYGGHDQVIPKAAMAACWRSIPAGGGGDARLLSAGLSFDAHRPSTRHADSRHRLVHPASRASFAFGGDRWRKGAPRRSPRDEPDFERGCRIIAAAIPGCAPSMCWGGIHIRRSRSTRVRAPWKISPRNPCFRSRARGGRGSRRSECAR